MKKIMSTIVNLSLEIIILLVIKLYKSKLKMNKNILINCVFIICILNNNWKILINI